MRIMVKYFLLVSILFSNSTRLIAQTVTSKNTDNVQQVQSLSVTITGQGTFFQQESGTLTSINPDNAYQGDILAVTITGQDTNFAQGSGTMAVWFDQGSGTTTIDANFYEALSDTIISADFDIPSNASIGLWNVNIWSGMDSILTLFSGFTILPPTDLIGEFSSIGFRYPPDPGADLQAEVKLLITNIGESATQPEQLIDMAFFLRPIDALDGSEDVLVSILNNILIDQLAPGRSKRIDLSVPIYIPALTYGTYRLGVYIDSSNDVPETNEGNNVITSDAIITIRGGIPVWMPDLTGEFSQIIFRGSPSPGAIVRAEIDISNIGNKATKAKQVIDIDICLRPCEATDDTDDISLITLEDKSISKLAPKSSKTLRATFNLPDVLDVGEYLLVAKVDSSEVVDELNDDNNEALSDCFIIE